MPVREVSRRAGTALLLVALLVLSAGCVGAGQGGTVPEPGPDDTGYRTVVDSRGVTVQVPEKIERVVTVSDGMVEGNVQAWGRGHHCRSRFKVSPMCLQFHMAERNRDSYSV